MTDHERYGDYLETGEGAPDDPGTRAALDELRGALRSPEVWAEPPLDLGDAVVAAVREEVAENTPVPRRRPRSFALLATAAAILVVLGVGAVLLTQEDDDSTQVALAATELAPAAQGEVTIDETGSGLSISLDVEDLPPAAPGTFYQAWMKGDAGSVPIGTFHAREDDGPIELWSGVDIDDYPTMTVTIQEEGAGPESSGKVVLSGDLALAQD